MNLESLIQHGKQRKPANILLHGPHGVGKSTFAASAPSPVFITGEEIEEVDAAKFPKCETYDDFINYLTFIRDEKHDFKTLVIDTVDSIQDLLHKKILLDDGTKDMVRAMGGYGRAYSFATQQLQEMRDEFLVPIRNKRGMNLIHLCHSSKNKHEDPITQSSYDVYEIKLHKNNRGHGAYSVFSEWVSIIGFANYEINTITKNEKVYATGDGQRVLHCTPMPSYDAKNRFNIPDTIELSYSKVNEYIDAFYMDENDPELKELQAQIEEMIPRIKDEQLRKRTETRFQAIKTSKPKLLEAINFIKGKP